MLSESSAVKKFKLIISDFHLGTGRYRPDGSINILEDFIWDDRFREFLHYHSTGAYEHAEAELIINGDFFNLLQSDPEYESITAGDPNSIFLTEEVLRARLSRIVDGHREVFESLRLFASGGRGITFIMGNHDPGILFESICKLIRDRIHPECRFEIRSMTFDGVYVEHGNQYDAPNAYNTDQYVVTTGGRPPFINLPWGSRFVTGFLSFAKRYNHNVDKVKPFKRFMLWLVYFKTLTAIKFAIQILAFVFRTGFTGERVYRFSIWRSLRIILETPVFPPLIDGAKEIFSTHPRVKLVVFGHNHVPDHLRLAPGKEYMNTGCWNQYTDLRLYTLGSSAAFTYALIEYPESDKNGPSWTLKEWRGYDNWVEPLRPG